MRRSGSIVELASPGTWAEFCVWLVLGAAVASGLLAAGSFAGLPILIGVVWLAVSRPALLRSGFGAMTGVGVVSLYVAYVQRRGPGTVCWHTATASGCDQYLNPWPWLAAGAALTAIGVVAHARRMRTAVK
jgi:hypothetical protein